MLLTSLKRRSRAWLGLLAALFAAFAGAPARAELLVEDAIGDAATTEATPARWESFAVSSARSRIGNDGRGLAVELAAGDHAAFSRAADLSPAPSAVRCTFNVGVSGIGTARPTTQVFRMGWDFGASNGDEADVRTYGGLGLLATEGDGFQLRELVGGRVSGTFHGTQAVSWYLNNSGATMSYAAPNGTVEAIGNDRMDVWVGRDKVFDDILATTPSGRITDLKWFWSRGSGSTRFDHFEISTLEPASANASLVSQTADLALEAVAGPADGSIELERPTPNPFTSAMRFAYAIPGGSKLVDIGVFDIAGRRVRLLARGSQTPGQYEVRWDGLGDDGKRVKHGVYFLRASIGATSRVSRVVYLSN